MLKIEIIDLDKALEALIDLPEDVADQAVTDVNKYMLNVLRTYPPYKHVPFKKAYGGWFSEKQRRFVMAAIRDGRIRPGQSNRTQAFSHGWESIGSGRNQTLRNTTPYGKYLQGDEQANMMRMIGWKKVDKILQEKEPRILEIIKAAVNKIMKKRFKK